MNTPLRFIRIRHSDHPRLTAGQHFDTLADFDATLRQARRAPPHCNGVTTLAGFVHFVITWKDGAAFYGRYDLERSATEDVAEFVIAACGEVLDDEQLHMLLAAARFTVLRLFQAVCAERGMSMPMRPSTFLEVPCLGA